MKTTGNQLRILVKTKYNLLFPHEFATVVQCHLHNVAFVTAIFILQIFLNR